MPGFAIAHVRVEPPLVLAPMAGYTSSSFRLLAREAGCGLVYSEVIAVKGLLHQNRKTAELLSFHPEERPIGIQLLTADPNEAAEAVSIIEASAPDLIDLNFGCPKPKVTRKGEGGALLADPDRASAVVRAVCQAATVPVTVKLRIPEDYRPEAYRDFCLRLVEQGAAALTVHPRTVADGFRGRARWEVLADLAPALPVPLIASGDARTPDDVRLLLCAGCAGVMIGRAAVGNPQIFLSLVQALDGADVREPTAPERLALCLRHFGLLREEKGDRPAVCEIRKQLSRYMHGVPRGNEIFRHLLTITEADDLRIALEGIRDGLLRS